MHASDQIRTFAASIAGDHPEISYDLMALAEKVAGQVPPEFLEQQKKKKDEAKGKDKDDGDDKGQQQKEAGYQSLRSLIIRTAHAATPATRQAFQPLLEALKK